MDRAKFAELNCFVAVAERRSFVRAATDLQIAPSTISQIVRSLEERLGVGLFNRTTRQVSLTDAGEKLLARVRPAISELTAAIYDLDELRDTPTGLLRLNVSNIAAHIILKSAIKEFLAAYPGIVLNITADEGQTDIMSGRFDAGISLGRLLAKNLDAVRLTKPSRLIAVAAPGYLDDRTPPKSPRDLQSFNCIGLQMEGQVQKWAFTKGKTKLTLSVSGSLIVNNMHLVVEAALGSLGIGFSIESYVLDHIRQGRLVRVLPDWSSQYDSYYLYYPARQKPSAALRAFIAFMQQRVDKAPFPAPPS